MACPWLRQCRRWSTNCTSRSLLETLRHFNGRSVPTFSTACLRRTSWSSRPGSEGQLSALPTQMLPKTLISTTSLPRHTSQLLNPTLQSCCCRQNVHTDVKLQDPFTLAQKDLTNLYDDIRKELFVSRDELKSLCDYYFDGKGKAIRPMIVVLMARALNAHSNGSGDLLPGQRTIAMIAEMIHTASLVHDDVIDGSDRRRGKRTINEVWGEKKAILAGDFILSTASMAMARIGDNTVVKVMSQVMEDLVRGEFMQLGSKEHENERFKHYLEKTFKKTASLIANSCKAVCTFCFTQISRRRRRGSVSTQMFFGSSVSSKVCVQVTTDPKVHEIAYKYGENVGIAFQLVDDVLDFTSGASHLGKPSAADLKLGLATGPVLFACQQFPELHALIMRRFSSKGDIDQAWQYVLQSDGVEQTKYLAERYCQEAIRQISKLRPSAERDALIRLTEMVLTRDK
ncbi:all trans-polyprenyl-diphosphate synthase PDSS1 isoform X1 [Anarrhichthys ocellatus]|uniref:all trans-polyprenyl-diphosphate synthase PDSS1 isoform X1 n=1 Tax=Anarrhichthys ocellatus TaxID=433405 RepID=UPI0012EE9CC9|nr:decaprenyl-diphosphate synthase subunit 1 isoform X1 [Anarrhichthys ocellatus]